MKRIILTILILAGFLVAQDIGNQVNTLVNKLMQAESDVRTGVSGSVILNQEQVAQRKADIERIKGQMLAYLEGIEIVTVDVNTISSVEKVPVPSDPIIIYETAPIDPYVEQTMQSWLTRWEGTFYNSIDDARANQLVKMGELLGLELVDPRK